VCLKLRLKKEQTQLIWKFQAVGRSERPKLGVKINYMAYYQDEASEIRKKASTGVLDLGVGLEPVLTSVQWFRLRTTSKHSHRHSNQEYYSNGVLSWDRLKSAKRQVSSLTRPIRTGKIKLQNGMRKRLTVARLGISHICKCFYNVTYITELYASEDKNIIQLIRQS
jgi:hypothetical protein